MLESTVALVGGRGVTLTVDYVAEACGVHKPMTDLRYLTRDLLNAAAIRRLSESAVPPVFDEDPRAAIAQHALSVAASQRSPQEGNVVRAVMAGSVAPPDLPNRARE